MHFSSDSSRVIVFETNVHIPVVEEELKSFIQAKIVIFQDEITKESKVKSTQ